MDTTNRLLQPNVLLATLPYLQSDKYLAIPNNQYFYEFALKKEAPVFSFLGSSFAELYLGFDAHTTSGIVYFFRKATAFSFQPHPNFTYFCVRMADDFFDFSSFLGFTPTENDFFYEQTWTKSSTLFSYLSPIVCAATLEEKITMFAAFAKNYGEKRVYAPGVRMIRDLLMEHTGQLTLTQLSDLTGYSTRHINRIFTKAYGFGPKAYGNRIRFQRVLHEMLLHPLWNNSDFIVDMGYADQAHFQREFQTLVGTTPKRFLKALNACLSIQK